MPKGRPRGSFINYCGRQNGKPTKLYRTWLNMRNRCNNPRGQDYSSYGGRGIRVAPQWDDFFVFAQDMGEPPSPEHTIERRDSNGHYEPANCYWATREVQSKNRSYCRLKDETRDEIRRLYATGSYTQAQLGKMFNVSQVRIGQVVRV